MKYVRLAKKINWLLILVLLVAFYFRFASCKPGFPSQHADEPMSGLSAFNMLKNRNIDPERYDYPSLVPILHALSYITFFIPTRSLVEGYLFIPKLPEDVFYWSRYFTAFLGTATVFIIYLISKKLFNWKVGILAAVILTFNYRHILNSHFGLPDIPNGLILSLSFLATLYLLEKPNWKRYVINGILMGLSFSTKYQVFAIPPFLLAHLYIQLAKEKTLTQVEKFEIRNSKLQTNSKFKILNSKQKILFLVRNLIDGKVFLALLLIPIIFVFLNPYLFKNLELALHQVKDVSLKYGVGRWKFYDFSYYYLFNIGIGRVASIAILLGMAGMFIKGLKKWLLLMSVVLPFFFVLTFYSRGGFYVRNFVTIIPFLTIFGGWVVERIVWGFGGFKKLRGVVQFVFSVVIIGSIVWSPLKNSLVLVRAYQDDYNFRKVRWFIQYKMPDNVNPVKADASSAHGVKIAAHSSVPIPDSKPIERVNFEQKDYYTLRELQEAEVDFAVTNTDWDGNHFFDWMGGGGPYENFGQVPKKLLSEIFPALALNEIYQYSIAEFIKPWQAPESNFSVIKVPPLPKTENKKLMQEFSLDAERSPPLIPVDSQDKILVSAKLKNLQKIAEDKKDGVLRVDLLNSTGLVIATHLGSRVYGEPNWQEKQVYLEIPKEVGAIAVSFIIGNVNTGEFLIEKVEVYEVKTDTPEAHDVPEVHSELPYIEPEMNLDLLFPKSML